MHPTDRIPGFAICARCAGRRQLGPCGRCGLLMCSECRGGYECAVCHGERLLAARRAERRARLREAGRRAAVVALVAASGVTGMGAAFLPDATLCGNTRALREQNGDEMRLMNAGSAAELGPTRAPVALAPGWGEPLVFRCFTSSGGVTCCVVAPR